MNETAVFFSQRARPALQAKHLKIGCLIFEELDQVDFTGPFEVFSRLPDVSIEIISENTDPVRDVKGLLLTPTTTIAAGNHFDVLSVAGGHGQQRLMNDEQVLSLIRQHAASTSIVFSVCTGALLCGAAGVLKGCHATTHWAAFDLLPYYGAKATKARVVVDGNIVSCAGVTAGFDGALLLASLLRGKPVAEQIQLAIEYAPEPLFQSGTPDTARPEVLAAFSESYRVVREAREAEAKRFGSKFDFH